MSRVRLKPHYFASADGEERSPPQAAVPRREDWSALMARAQLGDQASYRALLGSLSSYVRSLARRAGIPGEEIEDAIQDVLLTIHRVRRTYDPARPFGPWLVAIARHRFADRSRRRLRALAGEAALANIEETSRAGQTNLHETGSELRRLHRAIAALPAGQRQAIEMVKLKELSLKEASALSGQSETALKVATYRAIRRLRRLLRSE
jgi:RNA polymerase sigma-70 factor (ECF subfamily)